MAPKKAKVVSTAERRDPQGLYNLLGVPPTATLDAINRAYKVLALQLHPDRLMSKPAEERAEAEARFKPITRAYSVLSNTEKRKAYDTCGYELEEEDIITVGEDYAHAFIPKPPTSEEIDAFTAKYKGSDEELDDLFNCYIDNKGDMNAIMSNILVSTSEDEERFKAIINDWIEHGDVEKYPKWVKTSTSAQTERRRRKEEADKQDLDKTGFVANAMYDPTQHDALLEAVKKGGTIQGVVDLLKVARPDMEAQVGSLEELVADALNSSGGPSKKKRKKTK